MKVVVDEEKRVLLPAANPGDRFTLESPAAGKFILTLVPENQSPASSVHIEKRDGFSVGVLNRPIDEESLAQAISEFP